jgi:hypothetical protein
MCGRFTLTADINTLQDTFPWLNIPPEITPRYNIAPTQPVAVVPNDGKNRLDYYNWGLIPSWAKDPEIGSRLINARSETLAENPPSVPLFAAVAVWFWRMGSTNGRSSLKVNLKYLYTSASAVKSLLPLLDCGRSGTRMMVRPSYLARSSPPSLTNL